MILLDTHVVVWLAFASSQLSRPARTAIESARQNAEGIAISDISLLELATLERKKRLRLNVSFEGFLREVEDRFVVLPITGRVCILALDFHPRTPAIQRIASLAAPPSRKDCRS